MALDRYEWLGRLASRLPEDCLVMSTYIGAVSFEWAHHTEEHHRTAHLGQMGDVIGMAVGLALALPHRRIVCLDGDGSVLMELGQVVAMGEQRPDNLVVFVVDNGVYESIGWSSQGRRQTATAGRVNLAAIAAGCGVPYTVDVTAEDELDAEIDCDKTWLSPATCAASSTCAPSRATAMSGPAEPTASRTSTASCATSSAWRASGSPASRPRTSPS